MISGFFGDEDTLFFSIDLIASDGLEMPTDVMLDTGFSYWLAMDKQDVDALDWVRLERQMMRTARGDFNFDIYAGKVRIDGQEFDIPVHVGEGLTEILIGLQWLKTRRLVVDMSLGILTLGNS
jgi:predicted aspartyl protease